MKTLAQLFELAKERESKTLVVAGAGEKLILTAVDSARSQGMVNAILVGEKKKIEEIASKIDCDLSNYEIVEEDNPKAKSSVAIDQIHKGNAQVLVKGLVGTADYMHAILHKEDGLMKGQLLSHVALFELENYHKLLIVTDAAVNIAPDLNEKIQIIQNAVVAARAIQIEIPKVACVGAIEKVNPGKMRFTEEAAILSMMNRRGQIAGCLVDGPFGFDNAISKKSAEIKKIGGEVAGNADIIMCDDLESANMLYKSFTYMANAQCAAIVLGTTAPVVLTSRADNDKTKLASIVLGVLSARELE